MSARSVFFFAMGLVLTTGVSSHALAIEPPRLLDDQWQIQSIAEEPELVTPTGCCFDDQGRLLVIECHTHFPPEDYEGPETDRIFIFDDTNQDGILDRQRLFHVGGIASMNLTNLGGGWIGVATRSEVIRLRDSDGDDVADQREVLLTHTTKAEYPHNGLGGLMMGSNQWLYVGQGENFGEPYELRGSDGSVQIGGGEGGNVFRCKADGSQLQRVATGFWNPFGLCFDRSDRLWAVGNDPDAMPPNRLLHVAAGGDYGFQFRFGRAGIHPLQSWNGELPGTLPMVAGTGEAACAVLAHGPHLWVTSWGDNRIERYLLEEDGASWKSKTEVVVQGKANFRPVGMAVAPDGSIYITDWVDRSYPVHRKGRLWRLSRRPDAPVLQGHLPDLTAAESNAARLQSEGASIASLLEAFDDTDPFIRQAAATGLVHSDQLATVDRQQLSTAAQRVGMITAWRWKELIDPASVPATQRKSVVTWGLADESSDVALTALRWATERNMKDTLPDIRRLLERVDLPPRLFAATLASIAYLETGSAARGKRDPAIEASLINFAKDTNHAPNLRALALRRLPSEATTPTDTELAESIIRTRDRAFSIDAIRLLAARESESAMQALAALAEDESVDDETRADALASLSKQAGTFASLINRMSIPRQPDSLRKEAKRIRNRTWTAGKESLPNKHDLEGWDDLVGSGGNPDAGRRVFFRTTCANCHMHGGRGAKTGPDLTTLAGQMTSRRVIESILDPSKEVGPLYVPWRILTVDGKALTGLKLDRAGVNNSLRFQGADGNTFEVQLADVEIQEPVKQSIMPAGLEESMTLDELRDLIAFLTQKP
ncbi:MAG: PVC-type heme-binding CxxCH protein [Rubripirellula sp.]